MSEQEFFQEIEHVEIPWGVRKISVPVFYYDLMTFGASILAPTGRVKDILPSKRMHPLRITPNHCVVSISAYEYRESDIGPYNEVSIAVPVTLDKPSPLFTGITRKTPEVPKVFIRHLPVTTEIAYAAGVEFAAYPKFIASIEFEDQETWVRCHVREQNRHILTFTGRKRDLQQISRSRVHPMNVRGTRILRSELIMSECDAYVSRNSSDVNLELGDHKISEELRSLKLGRVIGYQYIPKVQAILTPVLESYAI